MTFHVRRITPDDAERLRAVRLAALTDAPGSFWQTAAAEAARPPSEWQARARTGATGDTHATFVLDKDGDLLGMVGVYQSSGAPDFRDLVAMWVAPALRGTGAADMLLAAAVDWARTAGAIGVRLWVAHSSAAAKGLYARHGFERLKRAEPDKTYMPMLLTLDEEAAASPTFLARALVPWLDGSA